MAAPRPPKRREREDNIDVAERLWSAEISDISRQHAQLYALSTRLLYVASLVEWSFERDSQKAGLNSGEILVLDALLRLGPPYEASPTQLRAMFFISMAGMGKRLSRLEELGYVDRRPHETDGRSQVIRLTEAGLALFRDAHVLSDEFHTRALAKLPRTELRALSSILRNLQQEIAVMRAANES